MNRVRKQIHYSRAEKEQLTGYHIGVGVLDSGIFPHEDLKDQIRAFRDFTNKYQVPYDETGHGTHVCGILAGNYDMKQLFIDGFLRLVKSDIADLEAFFARLDEITHRHGVDVVISVSAKDEETPEYLKKYIQD